MPKLRGDQVLVDHEPAEIVSASPAGAPASSDVQDAASEVKEADEALNKAHEKAEEEKQEYQVLHLNETNVEFERLKAKGTKVIEKGERKLAEAAELIPDAKGVVGESQFDDEEVKEQAAKEDKAEEKIKEEKKEHQDARDKAEEKIKEE